MIRFILVIVPGGAACVGNDWFCKVIIQGGGGGGGGGGNELSVSKKIRIKIKIIFRPSR